MGDYVAPESTKLVYSVVLEGDPIFPLIWGHLHRSYPGYYAPPLPSSSTIGPLVMITLIIPQLIGRLNAGTLTQAGRGLL